MVVAFIVLTFGDDFFNDRREPAAVMRQCLGIDLAASVIFGIFSQRHGRASL
jgi:hypothetical protein